MSAALYRMKNLDTANIMGCFELCNRKMGNLSFYENIFGFVKIS